jgi:serine protease AprX
MARRKSTTSGESDEEKDLGELASNLTKTRIAPDLLATLNEAASGKRASRKSTQALKETPETFDVIIEFNRTFPGGGIASARWTLLSAYQKARPNDPPVTPPSTIIPRDDTKLVEAFGPYDKVAVQKSLWTDSYVFARLTLATIQRLSEWMLKIERNPKDPDSVERNVALVYKIWRDHKINRFVYTSAKTIKCDAAMATFAASGSGIVWAVADTGIDASHPHFRTLNTTRLEDGLRHKDFTQEHPDDQSSEDDALKDIDGHGTHVAGIIAGYTCRKEDIRAGMKSEVTKITIRSTQRKGDKPVRVDDERREPISGLASHCKLLSLKVLTNGKTGDLSNLLAAIGYIQKCNDNGRSLKIHGLNLSLGYPYDPEWFAAGQSPLCVEVDRLVRSGVCVVVAAGNAGYGTVMNYLGAGERAAHLGTISDPGNAELAITVGSTHRDMPHAYGISYFSAKGPTADGRMKPDLVAPGERIVSCAPMNDMASTEALFREDSGTSMAAPHVSGAIAAFLSVRGEFKGRPEQVKDIFIKTTTDLKRRVEFQGTGLLDLLRSLQSV